MRHRRLALLLVAVVLGVWYLLGLARPVEAEVPIRLGAASSRVREIDLHFLRDGSVVRDVTLHFPSGAPADIQRTVSLREGSYEVGVRLVYADGREAHVGRAFRTGAGDEIDLATPR